MGFSSIHKTYSMQHILSIVPWLTEFLMLLFLWDISSELLFSITAKPFFLPSLEVVDPLRLVFWICGEIVGSAFTWSEVTCYSCHLYFQAEMVSFGLPKGVWIWQLDPKDIPHTHSYILDGVKLSLSNWKLPVFICV